MAHVAVVSAIPSANNVGSPRILLVATALALIVVACSSTLGADNQTSTTAVFSLANELDAPPPPELDKGAVARGSILYQQTCAVCHRADRSGNAQWRTPKDDGSYPPPPHDNSGHTWHHPDDVFVSIVLDGVPDVPWAMPTFRGKLTEQDVLSVLEYLKSEWGVDERYFQWQVTWQDSGS